MGLGVQVELVTPQLNARPRVGATSEPAPTDMEFAVNVRITITYNLLTIITYFELNCFLLLLCNINIGRKLKLNNILYFQLVKDVEQLPGKTAPISSQLIMQEDLCANMRLALALITFVR